MRIFDKHSWAARVAFFPALLVIGIFIAFATMTLRVASVGSPVMGSDEYAYFQTAHYADERGELYNFDRNMQQVDNEFYPFLYTAWSSVSDNNAATVGRLLNSLTFCVSALLLFAIFARLFDRRVALIAALVYLVLPFSFYATTLLPEVEFQLFVYVLAYTWVRSSPRISLRAVLLGACISAVGYMIKPHAAAILLASAAYLFLMGCRYSDGALPARLWAGLWRPILYVAVTLITVKVLRRLLDPVGEGALVASFYSIYLKRLLNPQYLIESLGSIGGYFAGHLWIFVILFAPGVVALCAGVWLWLKTARSEWSRSDRPLVAIDDSTRARTDFALFMVLLIVAMFSMISMFTHAASATSTFEIGRLHGRYLSALIPFVMSYSIWAAFRPSRRFVAIVTAAIALFALAAFIVWGRFYFRIFPWDYPDAFGLFSVIRGGWAFDGVLAWPMKVTCGLALVCWMGYAVFARRAIFYVVFIVGAMLVAHVQMSRWLVAQDASTREIVEDGKAIRTFLGNVPNGSGVVVTTDRFGPASFLLASLDALQHVVVIVPEAIVSPSSLPPGVSWLIVDGTTRVALPDTAELRFGRYRLILLDGRFQWPDIPEKQEWKGEPLFIDTSTRGNHTALHGFNEPEGWGSWSAREDAYVALPAVVSGPVRVSFFGWVLDPSAGPLSLGMGDSVKNVTLTAAGVDYSVELDPTKPSDRLYFKVAGVKMDGSRRLGAAVARIRVERIEKH